jgi:16S rRNA (cytidine1402-2'-O)-methyltransferase
VRPAIGTVVLFEAPGRLRGLLADLEGSCGDRFVVVAHELTKVHESWHRGKLSDLTRDGLSPGLPERGEFVVMVSDQTMGEVTKGSDPFVPDEADVAAMFERVSQDLSVSRRQALNRVAAAFSISNKAVYAIVERWKVSGK